MLLTQRALVIKTADFGESDKLLTCLTESGNIVLLAKGARRNNSRFLACSQLLSFCEFTFIKKSSAVCVARGCSLIENFYGIRENPDKLFLATYFCELLLHLGDSLRSCEALRFCLNSFHRIEKSDGLKLMKPVFELKLMCLAGLAPSLSRCCVCGENEIYGFSVKGGGSACRKCSDFPLSFGTFLAVKHIVSASAEKLYSFSLSAECSRELFDLCEKYITEFLNFTPKTRDFVFGISDFSV